MSAPSVDEIVKAGVPLIDRRQPSRRKKLVPYELLAPAALYLGVFFLIPIFYMFYTSLQSGFIGAFHFNWHFANYSDAVKLHGNIYIRSIYYAGMATALCLVFAFPVAYWIAFYGGRRKSVFLFLLLLPFFVSFIIRTIEWQFLLKDDGLILEPLKRLGLLSQNYHVLGTTISVVAGITYNFLPFMALPLYVSLEQVDPRLIEAAGDLYASKREAFLRVILPLTIPGIFAAFLLTFVPAVGDYVNASILGGPSTTMIGNIIQTRFLVFFDYPSASALSAILMTGVLIGIFLYARILGTRSLEEYV